MPVTEAIAEATTIALVRDMCANGDARRLREAAHLSLAEVGAAIDVAPPVLARWELGQCLPRRASALRYGALLGELSAALKGDQ